jgi:hypothetical protein
MNNILLKDSMLQRLKRDRDEFLKELNRLSQAYETIIV